MMPIGPLMVEHRLIERMIIQVNKELRSIQETERANPNFVEVATDFFRVYADFCHHGKEEHILFSELEGRELKPEHRATMAQLIQEHIHARQIVKELIDANERYERSGEALHDIEKAMKTLSTFYPRHIEKEDKHFFLPAMEYFRDKERDDMLAAFYDFDRRLIHELYNEKVLQLEQP